MKSPASLLVVPAYLVLTLVLTWPLVAEFGRALPVTVESGADILGGPFLMGWVLKALSRDPSTLFDLPIFYPEPKALAYTDHVIGEALLASPLVAATGNLAVGYNGLIVFSFVASAWAVYRLVRLFGVSRPGAFLSGLLFAFAPYRFGNLTFLNQIQTQFVPLFLFFALRFLARWRIRDLVGATAALVVQSYFGWYYTFYIALAAVVLVVQAWRTGRLKDFVPREAIALAAVAALALILPGLLPYIELRREMVGYGRTLGMTAMYSADLLDYLRINRGNWLLGHWPSLTAGLACWPGLAAVPLAVLGLGALGPRVRRAVDPRYFLWLGGAAFLLSLGPVLHVAGRQLPIPLPYLALYFTFPGFNSLRGPARLAVLFLLATVVLAGLGHDRLSRWAAARGTWAPGALFGGLLAVAIVSSLTAIQMVPFPHRDTMPAAYEWLASQPEELPMLDLPVPPTESEEDSVDALRQFYMLYHGHPRLDGVSGFVPPAVSRMRATLQKEPDAEAVHELARRGARFLVVHLDELDPGLRSFWLRPAPAPGLVPRARFGEDLVVEVSPSAPDKPPLNP